jgi:DNA-binding GntR family transcriptional regulator
MASTNLGPAPDDLNEMTMSESDTDVDWSLPSRRPLPEIVADRITEAIRSGELQPGERIVELQLAKKLGVSRAPLREALKTMEANHLVESQHGRGTFVREPSVDEIVEMMTMRATLEGLAARLVTRRMTSELADEFKALSKRISAAAGARRVSEWRDLTWQFHGLVCSSAKNGLLLSTWRSIRNFVRLFIHAHPGFEADVEKRLSNQASFLAALLSGDPERAERTFRSVILRSAFERWGLEIPADLADLVDDPQTKEAAHPTEASPGSRNVQARPI